MNNLGLQHKMPDTVYPLRDTFDLDDAPLRTVVQSNHHAARVDCELRQMLGNHRQPRSGSCNRHQLQTSTAQYTYVDFINQSLSKLTYQSINQAHTRGGIDHFSNVFSRPLFTKWTGLK